MLTLPAGKCRCQPASCKGAAQQGKGCNVSLTHLAGLRLLPGPAGQGWDSRAGVGSGASVVQGSWEFHSRRLKRGDSSHSARPAESHRLHQLPAGITAKPQQKQQVFGVSQRKKGSRHEAHCAHTEPQLENTAVSCKMWSDTHSDDTLLPFSSLPPYPTPATQSTSVLRTENCFLFLPPWSFFHASVS